jgi:protein O-mannosyl-transferase
MSKSAARVSSRTVKQQPPSAAASGSLLAYCTAAVAVLVAFWAYSPALHGPFLFDDTALPFALPGFAQPLRVWIAGVRPALMFTYWVNARISGEDPFSYHVVNVAIHCVTSGLVFLIVRRLVRLAGVPGDRRTFLGAFAALLFLLHPTQTEAVAYLAGRSEALSVMLLYAAYAAFLCRKSEAVHWIRAAAVLLLFGLALLAKEHTIVLPALLLLTDYWWNPGFSTRGIRANWRVYAPLGAAAIAGVAVLWELLTTATTAGFGLKEFTWYQYFFTQWRALFVYLGTFLFPVRLNADWDFPISRTPLEYGAIAWGAVLVALIVLAWRYRRRFPLASFGFFAFLLLMAPTSSILPIRDPVAERRLYLGSLGLLLVVVDFLSRWKVERKLLAAACGVVLLACAGLTYARAAVWGDSVRLWEDTSRKSPAKSRAHFQLGFAYYEQGRFEESVAEFEKTAKLETPNYNMLIDWGLALDGLNRPAEALAKLRQAVQLERTAHGYTQIAMVYAKRAQWAEALQALEAAESIDPKFAPIYNYRAKIHLKKNELPAAIADYQRALALDPRLADARQELGVAEMQLLRRGR